MEAPGLAPSKPQMVPDSPVTTSVPNCSMPLPQAAERLVNGHDSTSWLFWLHLPFIGLHMVVVVPMRRASSQLVQELVHSMCPTGCKLPASGGRRDFPSPLRAVNITRGGLIRGGVLTASIGTLTRKTNSDR